MTDYDAANLLSRLRAERAGLIDGRKLTPGRPLEGPDASVSGNCAATEYGEASGRKGEASSRKEATIGDDLGAEDAAQFDAYVIVEEEIGLLRAIRAKADRVDARLESLQAWVAETRSWIEAFETAHRTHSDLGRIVLESQARIDTHTKLAEERASRIIAEAKEQAQQLLAAAEVVAAELLSADADVLEATPTPAEPAAQPPESAATRAESSIASEVSVEDAEALYEVIELFTRMNTELLNELNALVGAIPRRSSG